MGDVTCNRCGDCCERVIITEGKRELLRRARNGQGFYDHDALMAWLRDLRYVRTRDGYPVYRCMRFRREEDGTGTCTRYEERPAVCRDFPYGRAVGGPAWHLPRCAWRGKEPS